MSVATMMTDCSSMQGSTTSSSSDVMTLTTASSWCAIPPSSRIRVLRLVRPNTRRILVTPDTNPSYGFAVRGGKEFGTGFFVSNVERNSEAELKGLRVGDQILRINGFRVDDAVHKEFIQFVASQDRIMLKVRGVGMLPVKEKDDDRLSWHVVKIPSVSNTPSEYSFKSNHDREKRCKDINVVLNVAPRTKLGLGICKGPEWKPGIFVQFTKDNSVAREAGLRQGDQILSVNSIDFSDVLFSEAVAVMKSASKLEMVVRTAAGCDLFPGESSGYNSSASSVTGDQSPCWADAKSKRLTAVREESNAACWNESLYGERQRYAKPNVLISGEAKEINKTIIKLSESGTSINNTYIANPHAGRLLSQPQSQSHLESGKMSVTHAAGCTAIVPPPPPPANFHFDVEKSRTGIGSAASQNSNNTELNFPHQSETKTVTVEVHQIAAAEAAKRQQSNIKRNVSKFLDKCSNNNYSSVIKSPTFPTIATTSIPKPPAYGVCSNNTNTNNNNNDSTTDNSHAVGGSSLSSAINEELKKRKEKQRMQASSSLPNNCNSQNEAQTFTLRQVANRTPSVRATSSAANCGERPERSGISDQHSMLMDEFKRAHQRMFKNGFRENEGQERQEALKRTTMMEDDVSHRNSNAECRNPNEKEINGQEAAQHVHEPSIPPPPPQFANSPPSKPSPFTNAYKTLKKPTNPVSTTTHAQSVKPPTSPVPDYDNVQMRATIPRPVQNYANMGVRESSSVVNNRLTMRLGTVTIGEYEHQRKELVKSDVTPTKKRNTSESERTPQGLHSELQNTLTRTTLKKSNGHLEHRSNCPLKSKYDNFELRQGAAKPMGKDFAYANRTVKSDAASSTRTSGVYTNGTGTGTGILKNGSRNGGAAANTKNTEKSITFGN